MKKKLNLIINQKKYSNKIHNSETYMHINYFSSRYGPISRRGRRRRAHSIIFPGRNRFPRLAINIYTVTDFRRNQWYAARRTPAGATSSRSRTTLKSRIFVA